MQSWEKETPLSAREKRQLTDDGYLVREGIFSRNACDALNAHLDRKIEEAAEEQIRSGADFVRSFSGTNDRLQVFYDLESSSPLGQPAAEWRRWVQRIGHGLHVADREFHRFCSAPAIASVLEEALPPPVKVVLSVVVYKQPNHNVGHYPWHQDGVYVNAEPCLVNTFIALDDMTEENGCLQVAPGSHRGGLDAHPHLPLHITIADDSPGYPHREFEPKDVVSLPIPQGSVVFLPGHTYHRSSVNRSNRLRRSLLLDSVSASSRTVPESLIHEPAEGWMPIRRRFP